MERTARRSDSGQRDARGKLAEHRLSVLGLARELANVAEACRQRGLDQTSFYERKRRFQTQEVRRSQRPAPDPQELPADEVN